MRRLSFEKPLIMGILNYTSDSFYDGGRYNTPEKFFEHAEQLVKEGADILDIGVASTRPGAPLIEAKKEWQILKPLLATLRKQYTDILISVDTYNSYTAEKSIEEGVDILNDISGGTFDPSMFDVVSQAPQIHYVLMHTSDIPERMLSKTNYTNVVQEVKDFLKSRVDLLEKRGCSNILIDPGFGFGKTIEQNFELLKHLEEFQALNKPILVGLSRKSMIYKTLNTTPDHALAGTLALNTIALLKGAHVLRVHDVKENKEIIQMVFKCTH